MCPEAARVIPPHARPLWFAAFIAGVSVPVAFVVVLVGFEFAQGGLDITDSAMRGMAVAAIYGVPLSLVVMFVVGFPLVLLLRKLGWLWPLNIAVGAMLIGAIVGIVTGGFPMLTYKLPLVGAVAGLFAAIVFCLVAGISFGRSAR